MSLKHRNNNTWKLGYFLSFFPQSAAVVEYTDCTSAEGYDPPPPEQVSWYDTWQSDGVATVMLEFWGMQRAPLLPLLPGPLWLGEIAPDRVLSIGQIEIFDHFLCNYAKLNCFKSFTQFPALCVESWEKGNTFSGEGWPIPVNWINIWMAIILSITSKLGTASKRTVRFDEDLNIWRRIESIPKPHYRNHRKY